MFTVGSLDLMADRDGTLSDLQNGLRRQDASGDEPMAVGAKHDGVVDRVRPAVRPGNDVVNITRRFIPTTPHTTISEGPLGCHHPTALVGVGRPLGDGVGLALIPRVRTAGNYLAHHSRGRKQLGGSLVPVLMPSDIATFALSGVNPSQLGSATAGTFDLIHCHAPLLATIPYSQRMMATV